MPRRDGTGPMGYGPSPERGAGYYCRGGAGMRNHYGYGRGGMSGFGRSHRWGRCSFPVAPTSLSERKRMLEEELKELDAQLARTDEKDI
ncbi:MAG: DUF5320 domain-containing protein [Sphaerochaetaceae bacterium]